MPKEHSQYLSSGHISNRYENTTIFFKNYLVSQLTGGLSYINKSTIRYNFCHAILWDFENTFFLLTE
eukprot:UN15746